MKKWCFLVVAIVVSLVYVPTAKGAYADDFLKALQDSLHKLGDPWIAGTTSVSHLSWEEKQKLCGTLPPMTLPEDEKTEKRKLPKCQPPSTWDWHKHTDGYNWMSSVKHQSTCGACWCFAIISAMEGCRKITDQTPNADPNFSEQFQISCDISNNGCEGGVTSKGMSFLKQTGVPDEACYPYRVQDWRNGAPCEDKCDDWQSRVEKIKSWGQCSGDYKNHIMQGPIVVSVYDSKEDFFYYKGGVYVPIMGKNMERHAVCCVGWDASGKWTVKNSFGKSWGVDGYGTYGTSFMSPVWLEVTPPVNEPRITLRNSDFNEPNNNIWEIGETVNIIVTLENTGIDATNVTGVLSADEPNVTIVNGTFNFGSMAKGSMSDNSGTPYKALAKIGTPAGEIKFKLHVTADGDYSRNTGFIGTIGWKSEFDSPGELTMGLAFDGTYLWVVDYGEPFIKKLNAAMGNIVGEIVAPGGKKCVGITWDWKENVLWVHNHGTKKIYKVDLSNGNVLDNFASPATSYPTGLAFDGEHLWAVDRDEYKIYKLTTSGTVRGSFSIPVLPKPDIGPRGLAFEPAGPNGGSLLLVMTHYKGEHLDSTVVWEISRDGSLVPNHHFREPPTDGRSIAVHPGAGKYWIDTFGPPKIRRVDGFYGAGAEESISEIGSLNLIISPNPSRDKTSVGFYVPDAGKVNLNIYDIAGKLVYSLVDGILQSGNHKITWDGKDKLGKEVPYGIYFYRLESGKSACVEKIILLK